MRNHVTVVPIDQLIFVDGEGLVFDYQAPKNLHALQWHEGSGHIEWTNDYNDQLSTSDYEVKVAPFVQAWEAEQARLAAEAEQARLAAEAEYASESARASRVRIERDKRIIACDYTILADYPMAEESKSAWVTYRQALRDLPAQEGFPWDGGSAGTPWPAAPLA